MCGVNYYYYLKKKETIRILLSKQNNRTIVSFHFTSQYSSSTVSKHTQQFV